ncbi:mRNA cleavage and polyadenylation factor subunit [Tilletia horrida]|uniref:mRNA cleavage and polyadenylation factor subunit n=1 Tax=Tilletia horrida TaxID=155126 RepID=A0AAN6JTB2_9BASI|nr:mRNA cleavage and polyadenylation factor subunit [Tilletia horrida]
MVLQALHNQLAAASGAAFTVALNLNLPPAPTSEEVRSLAQTAWPAKRGRLLGNVVIARDDTLRVYEVREPLLSRASEAARVPQLAEGESFEGEAVQLFGNVTGLAKVKTIASAEDGRDRLLVSFKDAKIALLEWSDSDRDLVTVSIHTYERAAQLAYGFPLNFQPAFAVDPADRCAALLLPQDAIAVLPFLQDTAELELFEGPQAQASRSLPYAPSFVLPFAQSDPKIRGVRDLVFLPGFQKPTLAVLYAAQQTWTGRLAEAKDTCSFAMITLDMTLSSHPVISERHGLPYDCFQLIACPVKLGGCMVVAPSAVLHIDQASKVVGVAVNGWHALSSALPLPHAKAPAPHARGGEMDVETNGSAGDIPLQVELQGSQLFFVDDATGLILLRDNTVLNFRFLLDGRSISSLSLNVSEQRGMTASSLSILETGRARFLVCGSMIGDTVLKRLDTILTTADDVELNQANQEDDMELDVDLYGEEAGPSKDGSSKKVRVTRLTEADRLQFMGPITDLCERTIKGSHVTTFVATIGAAAEGGLAVIEPQVMPRKRRRLNVEASDGIWDVTGRTADAKAERSVLATSGGLTQLVQLTDGADPTPITVWQEPTLYAAPIPDSNFFARLSPDSFDILTQEGEKVTSIPSSEDETFLDCQVTKRHIVIRTNSGLRLVQLQLGKKRILHALDSFGEVTGRYHHAVYIDKSIEPGHLVTLSEESHIEVYDLTSGELRWRSRTLLTAASRLDTHIPDAPHPAVALNLVSALFFDLQHILHCAVLYDNGLFVVYEACRWETSPPQNGTANGGGLTTSTNICFVKRLAEYFGPTSRLRAIPFTGLGEFDGLFLCGSPPRWILRSPQSEVKLFVHDRESMHAFTKIGGAGSSLIAESHGAETWLAEVPCYSADLNVLYEAHRVGRTFSQVRSHPHIRAIVAASKMDGQFTLFEPEEGAAIGDPSTDPIPPKIPYGSIELFVDDLQAPVHGFEFEANEFVTAMEIVTLDTMSHLPARKEFVAVGTTWFHGEDRPTRGATYIFDVVEVVSATPEDGREYRLRLLGRDDFTKGPVTAITDLNGYIVTAVGQKLFVRAFEQDQWLVAVAFLDMFFYTTSLRKLKNFIIATDAQKSVSFIMFQEEPYRLFSLGRDYRNLHLTGGDFIVSGNELILSTTDVDGVVRLHDYNPAVTTSHGGQRLLLRTEFQTSSEATCTLRLPRFAGEAEVYDASEVVFGKSNGGIETLIPVSEQIFKRLQLLQSQLVRNVQHVAGLNPRAYRAVHNDSSTRPLAKGILDGTLLDIFVTLSWPRMVELASGLPGCVGGPQQVLDELYLLRSAWLFA